MVDWSKLDTALARIDSAAPPAPARADTVGNWDESKHPRGPDGKFISGSGGMSAIAADYFNGLSNKKPSAGGLAKHMLMTGDYSKDDISSEIQRYFGLTDEKKVKDIIGSYIHFLNKEGNLKPVPKTSRGKLHEEAGEEAPPAPSVAASPTPEPHTKAEPAPVVPPSAAEKKSAPLRAPSPAPPDSPATAKLKKAIYSAARKAKPVQLDQTTFAVDSSGKNVRVRLVTDTDAVPKEFYAKVAAAYKGGSDSLTPDVDKAMYAYSLSIMESLNSEQRDAVDEYQWGDYYRFNEVLRGVEAGDVSINRRIKHFSALTKKHPLPADTELVRGVRASFEELTGFANPEDAVGKAFVHQNFASFSRNQSVANSFGDTQIRVKLPAGAPALTMRGQMDEREVALDHHAVFRIDKVEKVSTSDRVGYDIHVTYLGHRDDG